MTFVPTLTLPWSTHSCETGTGKPDPVARQTAKQIKPTPLVGVPMEAESEGEGEGERRRERERERERARARARGRKADEEGGRG